MSLYKLSAIEIRNLFLEKKISSKEIVSYFLKRIKKYDHKIKSMITILEEEALKKASFLDQKKDKFGKLASVPIILKDIISTKNIKTTCGSKFLENFYPIYNASVVNFLEEEGAIIIGKSNLDEFAMGSSTENSAFFPTRNPYDLTCSPGGSSGGSAAALAARFSPIALGTDTGGSVRQPAALCNLVGFKPTYGRISRYGLIAFSSSLDHIGSFATDVKDLALTMEVLTKPCDLDSTNLKMPTETYTSFLKEDIKEITIGVPWSLFKNLKKEALENFKKSIEIFKNLKVKIETIDLDILKHAIAAYYIIAPAEASANLARFDGIRYGKRSSKAKTLNDLYNLSRDEGFGDEVKRRIMIGTFVLSKGFQDKYYKKAQKVRTLFIKAFDEVFKKCDLIATPTAPSTAFPINSIQDPIELYMQDSFTIPANMAGIPAINVPSGFDENKKPYGLQLMGPQLHDALVMRVAYAFEKNTNFKIIPKEFDEE